MNLTKWSRVAGAAVVLAVAGALSVKAMMMAPAPISQRVAMADGVVVGKVTRIEEKTVAALQFPGNPNPVEYKIAVVKIDKAFGNIKKGTEVRVGFIPPPPVNPNPNPGAGRPFILRRPNRDVQLVKDQEACLFLTKHFDASFYVANNYFDVITKTKETAATFDKDLAEIERFSKLLADPMAGLESKKADDRLTTIELLLARYRTSRPSATPPKQEPIPAAESKAILTILAEADWTAKQPKVGVAPRIGFPMNTPNNLFFRLGLTPEDGWSPPEDVRKVPDAAKKWLRDNADSYRIKHFVWTTTKEDSK